MMNEDKYVIIGCGGHARSVADVILYNEPSAKIVFLDDEAKEAEVILGFPVLSKYSVTNEKVIVALGDNEQRTKLSQKYYNNLTNVISKKAYVGRGVTFGKGIFVGHNAFIGVLSNISDFCIVNTNALVEHECCLKRSVFIAPNATVLGKVIVGCNSFIGASASIRDNLEICDNCIIGIGTSVVKNIEISGTYVGCPAHAMRKTK